MKKLLFMALGCLCTIGSLLGENSSNRFKYQGFSGGMMLHSGWVQSEDVSYKQADGSLLERHQISGLPTGIGGALRLHFGEHLRIGSEGYVSNLSYGSHDSHASIGWGGLLVDYAWETRRWTFFAGGTIGGGSYKNLCLLERAEDDFIVENNCISYRKYAFTCLVPFVGAEFAMNQRMHLVAKVDYLWNLTNKQPDFVAGPRCYIGFIFCH